MKKLMREMEGIKRLTKRKIYKEKTFFSDRSELFRRDEEEAVLYRERPVEK